MMKSEIVKNARPMLVRKSRNVILVIHIKCIFTSSCEANLQFLQLILSLFLPDLYW